MIAYVQLLELHGVEIIFLHYNDHDLISLSLGLGPFQYVENILSYSCSYIFKWIKRKANYDFILKVIQNENVVSKIINMT
jgi:hypothetical protein